MVVKHDKKELQLAGMSAFDNLKVGEVHEAMMWQLEKDIDAEQIEILEMLISVDTVIFAVETWSDVDDGESLEFAFTKEKFMKVYDAWEYYTQGKTN